MTLKGGCRCGAIRYEAKGEPLSSLYCHCRDCQYAAAGGPAHSIVLRRRTVTITRGEPRTYWSTADSGKRIGRSFCATCGTPVLTELEAYPENCVIAVGSLDDPSVFRPQASIWTGSAQPWSHVDPSLPHFEKAFRKNREAGQ